MDPSLARAGARKQESDWPTYGPELVLRATCLSGLQRSLSQNVSITFRHKEAKRSDSSRIAVAVTAQLHGLRPARIGAG